VAIIVDNSQWKVPNGYSSIVFELHGTQICTRQLQSSPSYVPWSWEPPYKDVCGTPLPYISSIANDHNQYPATKQAQQLIWHYRGAYQWDAASYDRATTGQHLLTIILLYGLQGGLWIVTGSRLCIPRWYRHKVRSHHIAMATLVWALVWGNDRHFCLLYRLRT
jgi:hypothetical protein